MVQISHWTTPVVEPKRFHTWFFLAEAPASPTVAIDGGEIHDYQWIAVEEAIRRHESGAMGLYPPTIMTLRSLRGYLRAEEALIGIAARDAFHVLPVFADSRDPVQVLFEGDAGYPSGDARAPGARHRAQLIGGCWHYLCEGLDTGAPRLDS
jgi:hypothetical protein